MTMEGLRDEAVAWACAHGLLMIDAKHPELCSHAPMAMAPSRLSRQAFELGVELSKPYNLLVDRLARSLDWVYAALERVLDKDEFTARLVKLCKEVEAEGVLQRIYLGINRSDYMLDHGKDLLQVELNTIASSFGCLSARVTAMHRFLLERNPDNAFLADFLGQTSFEPGERVPQNLADKALPRALATAAKLQLEQAGASGSNVRPLVLFVVQDGERNSFDQRWLEYELWDAHGVATIRRSLTQLATRARLEGDERTLLVDDQRVALVYYRAGYTPNDYPGEEQWDARTLLERSSAIKCPSVQYHLVGTKKVQQELARPGQLEKFVSAEDAERLRRSFAGLWSLDRGAQDAGARAAVEDAIAHPGNYVVKPQREGGGNNIYGENVRKALQTMSKEELAAHILMQRIFPKEVDACLVRRNEVVRVKALQELGVFGTFIGGEDGKVYLNEHAGHLLRTKQTDVDEGGVATGFSCLDSPYLV